MIDPAYIEEQREYNFFRNASAAFPFVERARIRARGLAEMIRAGGDPRCSILDVGCRSGETLEVFRDYLPEARLVGVDLVPEFIEEAQDTGEDVRQMDAHDMSDFADKEFTWVFCSHVLEHCRDLEAAWSEIRRITSGGIFLVLPLENEKDFEGNPSHYRSTENPSDWVRWLHHPEWTLFKLQMFLNTIDVSITYLRRGDET